MLRLLLCVAFFLHSALALDEVVDLGYAKYRGKSIGNGVMRWAGMRFARSPSLQEGLRFAAPQDPVKENGTVDASSVRNHIITWYSDRQADRAIVWTLVHRNQKRPQL